SAMRTSLFEYYARIRDPFAEEVCLQFADGVGAMPELRLHSDLRLEHYAVTETQRGIDAYASRSLGPGVIDLLRLLTSIRLHARARGVDGDAAVANAITAYRNALFGEPLEMIPQIAKRLRRAIPDSKGGQGWDRSDRLQSELMRALRTVLEELPDDELSFSPAAFVWVEAFGALGLEPAAANWIAIRAIVPSNPNETRYFDLWQSAAPSRRACAAVVSHERFFRPLVRDGLVEGSQLDVMQRRMTSNPTATGRPAAAADPLTRERATPQDDFDSEEDPGRRDHRGTQEGRRIRTALMAGNWDGERPIALRMTSADGEGEQAPRFFGLRRRPAAVAALGQRVFSVSDSEFLDLVEELAAMAAYGHISAGARMATYNRARDQEQILHEFEPRIVSLSQELVALVDASWEAFRQQN
ncbi:MAG: hypothetical protein AAF550_14225, partial [Myxococcota bacterium]